MRVDTAPIQDRGKLLTVPNLTYAPNVSPMVCFRKLSKRKCLLTCSQNPSRGAWTVLGQKINNSTSLTSWIVVSFASESLHVLECERLMSNLQKCCETLGENPFFLTDVLCLTVVIFILGMGRIGFLIRKGVNSHFFWL